MFYETEKYSQVELHGAPGVSNSPDKGISTLLIGAILSIISGIEGRLLCRGNGKTGYTLDVK